MIDDIMGAKPKDKLSDFFSFFWVWNLCFDTEETEGGITKTKFIRYMILAPISITSNSIGNSPTSLYIFKIDFTSYKILSKILNILRLKKLTMKEFLYKKKKKKIVKVAISQFTHTTTNPMRRFLFTLQLMTTGNSLPKYVATNSLNLWTQCHLDQ